MPDSSRDLVLELGKPFSLPIADSCVHESRESLNRGCLLNQWWELFFYQHRNLSSISLLHVISPAVRAVDVIQYMFQLSWAQVLLKHSDSQVVRAAAMGELRSLSMARGAEYWMMTGTLRMLTWYAESSSVEMPRKPITFQGLSEAQALWA